MDTFGWNILNDLCFALKLILLIENLHILLVYQQKKNGHKKYSDVVKSIETFVSKLFLKVLF